jgi:hypothetical protein
MRNQLNIKLDGALLDALKVYASSVGLTPSEVARVAIGEYLVRHDEARGKEFAERYLQAKAAIATTKGGEKK